MSPSSDDAVTVYGGRDLGDTMSAFPTIASQNLYLDDLVRSRCITEYICIYLSIYVWYIFVGACMHTIVFVCVCMCAALCVHH